MNPPKVTLFGLPSRYGVNQHFTEELAQGFRACGASVDLLRPDLDDFVPTLASLLKSPPALLLSLNAASLDFRVEGKSLHNLLGCPLMGLYIDDPLSLPLILRLSQGGHLVTQPSERLTALVKQHFSLPCSTVHFGASIGRHSDERPIDLLLPATYTPCDELCKNWHKELSRSQQHQVKALIDMAQTEEERPIWELWDQDSLNAPLVITRAEAYIRAWRRDRLVHACKELGKTVTLVGQGWGSKTLSYQETIDLMGKAKVVLHASPPFCAGSHERPLTAMLQGAAAVVDGSPFFREAFAEDQLTFYSWKDPKSLPDAVERALANWEELGKEGQKAVQSAHTWHHRAAQILELINVDRNR